MRAAHWIFIYLLIDLKSDAATWAGNCAGIHGSTSGRAGAGAAAGAFFLVARFFDFFVATAAAPRHKHNKAPRRAHNLICQIDFCAPQRNP